VQFDAKVDQHFSDKSTLSGRYSNVFSNGSTPTVFGDGEFNDGTAYTERVFNDDDLLLHADRAYAVDRHCRVGSCIVAQYQTIQSHLGRFPSYQSRTALCACPLSSCRNNLDIDFDQCCVDTKFAHTLVNYSSSFS
jgi:hypothetical protein